MRIPAGRNTRLINKPLSACICLVIAFAAFSAQAQTFRHPGVLVSQEQLDFVKSKIAAGEEPWKSAFAKMNGSSYASLTMMPAPRATVDCGAYSTPNNGCAEELNDAWSAYTQALLWAYTGNQANADKAIQILNAWAGTIQTHTNHNAPLQAGWAASIYVRAAEIIKHTGAGWSDTDVKRYGDMLRTAYLPNLMADLPNYNGNWHLTMTDAAMDIAIFLDDRELFNKTLTMWRAYTIAYIYVTEDGKQPILPPAYSKSLISYWYKQETYVDGLAQETCRDLGHTGYGLGSIGSAAETALLQGVDLYAEQEKRIMAGFEFHAAYLDGKAVPSWLCGGTLNKLQMPTWEIVYNHFTNRRGKEMPLSKRLIASTIRPAGVDKHMAWETLTHANTGLVGINGSVAPVSSTAKPQVTQ